MAKNTSNGIREFVKNSLNQYYKNFQVKLADKPQPTDINPTIKMVNDGSVYVYDIGGYDGISIQNSSTLQKVINSAENDIVAIKNDINILENDIQDLSTHAIKNIDAGNNIKVEKLSKTTAKISTIGYFYNEGKKSFAEGPDGLNQANGLNSHAEGQATIADGDFAHAEGITTQAKIYAHAEGHTTKAFGEASHAEGNLTQALGNHSHTEGNQTMANGLASHAEGEFTTASSNFAHAEGLRSQAIGVACHAEGFESIASVENSHAEGTQAQAVGHSAHAEGNNTTASGFASHAEGQQSQAKNENSHAEGYGCLANGISSHAEGDHTITYNVGEHASGRYNLSSDTYKTTIFSIGNGSGESDRKNVMAATVGGEVFINSVGNYDGTNITTAKSLSTVISEAQSWLQTLQNQKAEIDDTLSTTSKTYSSNKINSLINSIVKLTIEVVDTLPTIGKEHVLYLVASSTTLQENVYNEYLYINNTWELIGSTETDLSNYYTKSESQQTFASVNHTHSYNINGQSTSSISIYAPTTAGTAGQYLTSNGSGAPTWVANPATDEKQKVTTTDNKTYLTGVSTTSTTSTGYTNVNVYMQSGKLYSNNTAVSVEGHTHSHTVNGSTTSSVNLYGPTSAGTNGYVLKSNGSGAPTWMSTNDLLPIGTIAMWPTPTPPTNWLICNGATVSQTTYPALYDIVAQHFGGKLPDFRGMFPIGSGQATDTYLGPDSQGLGLNFKLGQNDAAVGEYKHKLTAAESGLPSHTHILNYSVGGDNGGLLLATGSRGKAGQYLRGTNTDTSTANASQAHNNTPPYCCINFIIKAK